MRPDQLAVLRDLSLPPLAVQLALRISELDGEEGREPGAGTHDLGYERVRPWLFRYPNRTTVSTHLGILVAAGWLARVQGGGGGQGAKYRWTGPEKLAQQIVQVPREQLDLAHGIVEALGELAQPPSQGTGKPAQSAVQVLPMPEEPAQNAVQVPPGGESEPAQQIVQVSNIPEPAQGIVQVDPGNDPEPAQNAVQVSEPAQSAVQVERPSRARVSSQGVKEVVEEDEEEDAGVSVRARELIQKNAALIGDEAVDALRTYLASRVPAERQYAYIRTVLGSLNGMGGRIARNDGTPFPTADLPDLLARALWDLLGSDESAMARPIGDAANLRTKMAILANPLQPPRRAARPEPTPGTEHAENATRGDSGGVRALHGRAGSTGDLVRLSAGPPRPTPAATEAWAVAHPDAEEEAHAVAARAIGLDPAANRSGLPATGPKATQYRSTRLLHLQAAMLAATEPHEPLEEVA